MTRFSAEILLAELGARGASTARAVMVHESVDSTSTDLARRLRDGAGAGTVVAAGTQTAGRGRSGRSWHSAEPGNLYLSLALECGPHAVLASLAAGVAAVDALAALGARGALLKWPNDVTMRGKKAAGILCEIPEPSRKPGLVVVGMGMNLVPMRFPPEIASIATSVATEIGVLLRPEAVAAAWIARLEVLAADLVANGPAAVVPAWKQRAEPFGRRVRSGVVEGKTVDLDPDGRLVIALDSGGTAIIPGGVVEDMGT